MPEPEPPMDDKHVFISCRFGIFRATVHRQAFRCRENDVVFKNRIDIRLYVRGRSPAGRAVFYILAELLRVLAFDVNDEPDDARKSNAYTQVMENKARHKILKRFAEAGDKVERFRGYV